MGYYIKRIFSIDKDSTAEKLENLANIFRKKLGYSLAVFDDHIDDSNWNCGMGISDYIDENALAEISEEFGEIPFTVHCVSEDNAIFEYHCCDGAVDECVIRETDSFYKMYEDKSKRSPGANQKYYEDYGPGPDYKFKYGNESVPAGDDSWIK